LTETMWVFGYGSLIWNPEFPVAERRIARVTGWQRSFCMRSIHHRGSVAEPGLVLALDASPVGACAGVAFRVAEGHEEATLTALRERELISSAYLETRIPAQLDDGSVVQALCYVIDRDHDQYCGGLSLEEQARIIAQATGGRGHNRDYLWATVGHLAELGIEDDDLTDLAEKVRTLCR
jgi:glutathione-specific gamma-glutamylcyclotransferase